MSFEQLLDISWGQRGSISWLENFFNVNYAKITACSETVQMGLLNTLSTLSVMMDSCDFTFFFSPSVVLVDWGNQAYMLQHYHPQTVWQSDCSSPGKKAWNVHFKTSEPWNYCTPRLFPLLFFFSQSASLLQTFCFLWPSPLCSCPTSCFFFFSCALAVVLFLPSRLRSWVYFFFNPRQPAISKCGSTWLCCPITGMTSVHLLPRHSQTLCWCCTAELCRNKRNLSSSPGEVFFSTYQGIRHISIRSCFLCPLGEETLNSTQRPPTHTTVVSRERLSLNPI